MMRVLKHLRDFMTEEELKFLPGRLKAENCMLLTQHTKDEQGMHKTILQVFTADGTWIGEIEHPDYIPSKD